MNWKNGAYELPIRLFDKCFLIFIMEIGQVNYDLDAIHQHAEWISQQQVEKLRDEDLIFAIEWFDYNQKYRMEQKRRDIIRKFIEFVTTNGFEYPQLEKIEKLLPKLFDEMLGDENKDQKKNHKLC